MGLPLYLQRLHSRAHQYHPRDLERARVEYLRLLVVEGAVTEQGLAEAAAEFDDGKVPCAWNPFRDEPDDPMGDAAAEIEAARRDYHDR